MISFFHFVTIAGSEIDRDFVIDTVFRFLKASLYKVIVYQTKEKQCLSKLDMCLGNTGAPGGNKVKRWQKSHIFKLNFNPPLPNPGGCDVSEVRGTLR